MALPWLSSLQAEHLNRPRLASRWALSPSAPCIKNDSTLIMASSHTPWHDTCWQSCNAGNLSGGC